MAVWLWNANEGKYANTSREQAKALAKEGGVPAMTERRRPRSRLKKLQRIKGTHYRGNLGLLELRGLEGSRVLESSP